MFSSRSSCCFFAVALAVWAACDAPAGMTPPSADVVLGEISPATSRLLGPPLAVANTEGPAPRPPASCELAGRVLLVVGDTELNESDAVLVARLAQLGLRVDVRDDDEVSAGDATGAALVVISKTVWSFTLGAMFTPLVVPVLSFEVALFDDLGFVVAGEGQFGSQRESTAVTMVNSGPLAGGLAGDVRLLSAERRLGWARPVAGATVIATLSSDDPRATAFAFERGATLADGRAAAGRRFGLGLHDDAAEVLTPAGWLLFDSAVAWLAGGGEPRPIAAFVVRRGTLSNEDRAVRGRLEELGYRIYDVADDEVEDAFVALADVIVVSSSVASSRIADRLTDVPVGLVNGEHALLDDLGMTLEHGLEPAQRTVSIVSPWDPLSAGLRGEVTVYRDEQPLVWGEPASTAEIVARTPAGRPTIFRYDTGVPMFETAAPARRVGFFWHQNARMTRAGKRLFDAAVEWASGEHPPTTCDRDCQPRGDRDAGCDGIDDDCDGAVDEDFAPQPSTCGVGVCLEQGATGCEDGLPTDSCEAAPPTGDDSSCDGLDNDCDGAVDESFGEQTITCGVGRCAATGTATCVDGGVVEACTPNAPRLDIFCDGVDDDCDGVVDEAFVQTPTTCGVGVCLEQGATSCIDGRVSDSCVPATPIDDDANCDGLDGDCDGAIDEGFGIRPSRCGVGSCTATGRVRCEAGQLVDSCNPRPPAADDAVCNGIDDDCDGSVDEDFGPQKQTCGVGVCEAVGRVYCVDGAVVKICRPGKPEGDELCDQRDNDCDGAVDELVDTIGGAALPRWSLVDVPGPTGTWGAAFAYDDDREQLVLFGGLSAGAGQSAETWAWTGQGWERLAIAGAPARMDHAMAYDPVRSRVVLFGGLTGNEPAGDTWEWDGARWALVASAESGTGPAPRYAHAMAYEPATGAVLLFGGTDDREDFGDTWLWDGASWSEVGDDQSGPGPRKGHAMALDDSAGAVRLVGGFQAGTSMADTWQWDGASWAPLTVSAPPPREEHTLAYDPTAGAMVAFGGIGFFSTLFDDVWSLAAAWLPVAAQAGPTGRFLHVMGPDPGNDGMLIFGGIDEDFAISSETWLLSPVCFGAE